MAMTLKQAFTLWANAPRNVVLAAKSREAVQRVLMKKYNNVDLTEITPSFAERIFSQSSECEEMRTKAAAILVYILQWGGDHGYCARPAFDPRIANAGRGDGRFRYVPSGSGGDAAVQPAVSPEEQATEPAGERPAESGQAAADGKRRGKAPKPVAQIDPETLEVVKVWPSRCEAERQTGARNLDRCIAGRRMSAGSYWCDPEEADSFRCKPSDDSRQKADPKPEKQEPAADDTPVSAAVQVPVLRFSVGDHVWACQPEELRGRTGYVTAVDTQSRMYDVQYGDEIWLVPEGFLRTASWSCLGEDAVHRDSPLAAFSDEEIRAELARRGWEGSLTRRETMTVGGAGNPG